MNNVIVRLKEIEKYKQYCNELYAYLGNSFPTGSIKDTTVYQMLLCYKKEGILKENALVIEATSGNTGISLAYYQKEFKYKALIIMPKTMSKERRRMITQYGGELLLVDGGMEECEKKAQEVKKEHQNSFLFEQFNSKYNPLAHYQVTGPEIYSTLGDVDYLFCGVGTGGTVSGTAKYLKEKNPHTVVVGIEPFESPLLTKGFSGSHLIQGIGANFIPNTYQKQYVDDVIDVKGNESIEIAKLIREKEKLDVGISSGAALLGAIEYIKNHDLKNKKIVIIFPDKGDRYPW